MAKLKFNYKRHSSLLVITTVILVGALLISIFINQKGKDNLLKLGIEAEVLEINKDESYIRVKGLDENNRIGDNGILTWKDNPFRVVVSPEFVKEASIDDFQVGDKIIVRVGAVKESYPTQAQATVIALVEGTRIEAFYPIDRLWDARTRYASNDSDIYKLVALLPIPKDLHLKRIEVNAESKPYKLKILYDTKGSAQRAINDDEFSVSTIKQNTMVLFALIYNIDEIETVVVEKNKNYISLTTPRSGMEMDLDISLAEFGVSKEALTELIKNHRIEVKAPSATYYISKVENDKTSTQLKDEAAQKLGEDIYSNYLSKSQWEDSVDITSLKKYYILTQIPEIGLNTRYFYIYSKKHGLSSTTYYYMHEKHSGSAVTLPITLYESLEELFD